MAILSRRVYIGVLYGPVHVCCQCPHWIDRSRFCSFLFLPWPWCSLSNASVFVRACLLSMMSRLRAGGGTEWVTETDAAGAGVACLLMKLHCTPLMWSVVSLLLYQWITVDRASAPWSTCIVKRSYAALSMFCALSRPAQLAQYTTHYSCTTALCCYCTGRASHVLTYCP